VAVVETYVAGPRTVSGDHVGSTVAVQVRNRGIASRPLRITPGARHGESPFAVVEVEELPIGGIVADDDVEIAVAVQISEGGCVGTIGSRAEI
jgi:hypothetical protein